MGDPEVGGPFGEQVVLVGVDDFRLYAVNIADPVHAAAEVHNRPVETAVIGLQREIGIA